MFNPTLNYEPYSYAYKFSFKLYRLRLQRPYSIDLALWLHRQVVEVQLPSDLVSRGWSEAGQSELQTRSREDLVCRREHLRVPVGDVFVTERGDFD